MKIALRIALFVLIVAGLSSCVSYEKSLLLKSEIENFPDYSVAHKCEPYKLQKGDVVYVEISKLMMGDEPYTMADHVSGQIRNSQLNPNLIGSPIAENGRIYVPLLGDFEAAGKTVDQLSESIRLEAIKMYSTSSVKVFLLTQYISVLGEVNKPGRYQYFTENLSVLEAIALAGGFTPYTDLNEIKIITTTDTNTVIEHIDLSKLSAIESNSMYLSNNAVILISPQKRKRFITNNSFGTVLSSITVAVTVLSLVISLNK